MIHLTGNDTRLIRESWARVVPIADTAATLFYDRLFQIDPGLKALFSKTDMEAQKRRLVTALDLVVSSLEAPAETLEELRALGVRHAGYGVKAADYESVGAALLWTLAQGLGERFTPEVRAAWTTAYALVAGTMRDAAARESAA